MFVIGDKLDNVKDKESREKKQELDRLDTKEEESWVVVVNWT